MKPAQKYLERMQPDEQLRIVEALDTLLTAPEMLDIKPLKGRPELRLRVGKYRVLFIEDQEAHTYVVTVIGARGDVYK
nr:type II toxin-antitoxin system RelE/ParE family toxin [Alkalinema sp. FACHB-956]